MLLVPSAKDLIPRFAEESTLERTMAHSQPPAASRCWWGNLGLGSLLDKALVPSTEAIYPWLLLAVFPLCSAVALSVICCLLRR